MAPAGITRGNRQALRVCLAAALYLTRAPGGATCSELSNSSIGGLPRRVPFFLSAWRCTAEGALHDSHPQCVPCQAGADSSGSRFGPVTCCYPSCTAQTASVLPCRAPVDSSKHVCSWTGQCRLCSMQLCLKVAIHLTFERSPCRVSQLRNFRSSWLHHSSAFVCRVAAEPSCRVSQLQNICSSWPHRGRLLLSAGCLWTALSASAWRSCSALELPTAPMQWCPCTRTTPYL